MWCPGLVKPFLTLIQVQFLTYLSFMSGLFEIANKSRFQVKKKRQSLFKTWSESKVSNVIAKMMDKSGPEI